MISVQEYVRANWDYLGEWDEKIESIEKQW